MPFLVILLLVVIVVLIRPGLLSNTIAFLLFLGACAWGVVIVHEDFSWAVIKNSLSSLAWIALCIGCLVFFARLSSAIQARKEVRERYQVGDGKPDSGAFDNEKEYVVRILRAVIRYLGSYKNSLLAPVNPDQRNDQIKLDGEKVNRDAKLK